MAQPSHRGPFELWGQLLPVKNGGAAKEEEDEEEEDDDEPFDALSEDSGQVFLRPSRRTVIIREEKSKKEYNVVGRFPFVGPWWKVNVKVKRSGSKNLVHGYPSYFLQTDAGENKKEIISLFLNKCGVPEIFQMEFFEWLPEGSPLNFIHLEEILEQFKVSKLKKGQVSSDTKNYDIMHYIKSSFAGKSVLTALAFPIVLEFLPKLLPYNVSDCIEWYDHSKRECEDDRLTKLDKILKEEPWKLGFSRVIYRELHTNLAEASLKDLCDCGHLYQKIPLLQRNSLILYEKLKERCREMGYTYEDQDKLTDLVSKKMSVEDAWQSLKFMKDEEIVIAEKKLVFLPRLYEAEKNIATVVYELSQKPPWYLHADAKEILKNSSVINNMSDSDGGSEESDEDLCVRDAKEPDNTSHVQENCRSDFDSENQPQSKESQCEQEVDPDQESAIEMICSNPVTVISGKGGCGKTTVVSCLFRFLMKKENEEVTNACKDFEADVDASEEWDTFCQFSNVHSNQSLNILFTAPTGKAAVLLFKKTKIPAYTLHQVKCSYYAWKESKGNSPWKFSKTNVLVVDEGSLVSVGLLSSALRVLYYGAKLSKLVILGDVRQLPSIEPGNMLADIFASLKLRGWSTELRTNHRSESQLIVDNATRISQQKYPAFDEVLKFSKSNQTWPMPSPEKKFILLVLPAEDGSGYLQSAIKALLEKGPGLEDPKQSQFITFRRKDCDIINETCCQHYSRHPMRDHKNRLQFLCGDKICSTRNEYLEELLANDSIICTKKNLDSKDSGPCICNVCLRREERITGCTSLGDTRLCNGEIFFIVEDKEVDKVRILTISITGGPEYTVQYKPLCKKSKIRHAWARTIHTFQGSEENTIVYVAGNAGRQNWQHVYTAVTRGRCRVYIVAEEAKLKAAIDKENFHRKTCLQKRLKEAFTGKMSSSQQPLSQQESLQNQGVNNWGFASPAGTFSIHNEESVVCDKMEINGGHAVDIVDTAEQTPGERKRQREFAHDGASPSKVAMITEETKTSPLGTSLLQKMTLESLAPKKLFSS